MGRCCGGKNAGKPISWGRFAAGVGVFCGYHGAVGTLLHVVAVPVPALRKVRDFHREVALTEFVEIMQLRDINVGGPEQVAADAACPVPAVEATSDGSAQSIG